MPVFIQTKHPCHLATLTIPSPLCNALMQQGLEEFSAVVALFNHDNTTEGVKPLFEKPKPEWR